ncbi:MAG: NADH-quinone oxidoreductase subunit J [Myxococcaceae bacterium]|nr:NADH-quinone oxidoreductase subunit J [Myxococcaceae bacterium]
MTWADFDPGFTLISLIVVVSAFFVVRAQNMIHAVLWLGLTLLGTAAFYARLNAPFLAGVQVLTYVGGIVTLMIFGVMVTRRHESLEAEAATVAPERGLIFASAIFVMLSVVMWRSAATIPSPAPVASSADLARVLLNEYLIAFEALSLLLLAAIVGAVVLARRRDLETSPQGPVVPQATEVQP